MKETKSLACLLAIGTAAAVAIVQFRQLSPGHTRSAISDRGETDQRTAPLSRAAVLLIVDKSGSMAGRNMELVKEACINTANCLSPNDVIAVVGFDYNAILVLDFTAADRSGHIEQRIRRLLASGGTRIYPALALALRIFEDDPHARQSAAKHAILV